MDRPKSYSKGEFRNIKSFRKYFVILSVAELMGDPVKLHNPKFLFKFLTFSYGKYIVEIVQLMVGYHQCRSLSFRGRSKFVPRNIQDALCI